MKTTVTKSTSIVDDLVEMSTLGVIKAEPTYTATVRDEGRTVSARSNDKDAAVASALSKIRN